MWPNQHPIAPTFVHRFNDQLFQIVENEVSLFVIYCQVGGNVLEYWLFTKIVTDHCRDISINCLVVGDSGTDSICQRNISSAPRIEQSGTPQHARRIERKWIEKVVIDSSIYDIDRLK